MGNVQANAGVQEALEGQACESSSPGFTFPWSAGFDSGGTGIRIHPMELQRRRRRCEPTVTKLLGMERKSVPACNLCGSERRAIVAQTDRYGFPIRTAMCLECGLFYLAERFTDQGYGEFYAGSYRQLTSEFRGTGRARIADLQADQIPYAQRLIRTLDGSINFKRGARLIDVGGSAGQVALQVQNHFGMKAVVLDPAADEVAAARELGLEGITGSFEQFETDELFHLILFCRSIEHVQDLRGVLTKMRNLLRPEGLLYCDIVDYCELCRLVGHPEAVSKIDHCYWLTQETATRIFRSLGLQIVVVDISLRQPLTGFLLRRSEEEPDPTADPAWIAEQLRDMQRRASEWQEWGRTHREARDWLRGKAYRMKRWLRLGS
jgi:SAM-dependent methyltransferase